MMTQVTVRPNGKILRRGPRPVNFVDFLSTGSPVVINLETGFFEWIHGRNGEEDLWAKTASRSVIHLPLSDFCVPTEAQVKRFIDLVTGFLCSGNVYVHCLHGVDRTGFMIAKFRILVQGWERERAIEEMLALGFHKFPYKSWIKSL